MPHIYDSIMCAISHSPAFQRRVGDTHDSLLVIQCDSGHLNGDLIACARYRIYDKRAETSLRNEREWCTHVLFIIHLPRQTAGSSFVGFQGEPWISTHIDDLRPTTGGTITLQEVMGVSISQLFCGKMAADKGGRIGEEKMSTVVDKLEMYSHTETESMQESGHTTTVDQDEKMFIKGEVGPHTPPWSVEGSQNTQFRRLHGCIQPAAARLQDSDKNKERATKRVAILVNLIPRDPSFPPGDLFYFACLYTLHLKM